jgi:hypothetical protein
VDPILEDDAAHWTFWQWSLAEGYLLALCAQRTHATPFSVQLWRALPLHLIQAEDTAAARTS